MAESQNPAVPKLRFPQFDEAWEFKRLGSLGKFRSGVGFPESEQGGARGVPFFKVSDMNLGGNQRRMVSANHYVNDEQIERLNLKPIEADSIVFAKVGAAIFLERKRRAKRYLIDNNMMAFVPSGADNLDFLTVLFSRTRLSRMAQVGALPSYNGSDLSIIRVAVPAFPEQQKIAGFFGAVDGRLTGLLRKRDLLADYKRGVIQQLFSQKLRFKRDDGSAFPGWEKKRLGSVLTEHGLKSAGVETVFSVSVHKGLVNQIEHLGRSFSAKETDHYNRVLPGDVVYTKSPTGEFPLGIVKQSKLATEVIVSPLYGVFTPETAWLGAILNAFFASNINVTNYLKPIVQKGAKNTINVTNDGFLNGTLRLPVDHDEQRKIADFLSALDAKIDAAAAQIAQTEAFKKGLLQQMFV